MQADPVGLTLTADSPHLPHTTGLTPSDTGTPTEDSTQVCELRFPLIPQRSSQGDRVRM